MVRIVTRVAALRRMVRGSILCGSFVLAATNASAQNLASARRFPVTSGAIVAAMQQRQVPVTGVQVRMAAQVTSSVAEPVLAVRSLTMGDKHSGQLLIACKNLGECLPFYASVSWPVEVDVESMPTTPREADVPGGTANRTSSTDVSLLRAGSQAMLLLDGERVHVMLRVVCLEGGEPGQKVRVATPDRRQQFVADVVAPGVLKGAF